MLLRRGLLDIIIVENWSSLRFVVARKYNLVACAGNEIDKSILTKDFRHKFVEMKNFQLNFWVRWKAYRLIMNINDPPSNKVTT